MSTPAKYKTLFRAYHDARTAYGRMRQRHQSVETCEATDPDFLQFHQAGIRIVVAGGEAALMAAIASLSEHEDFDPVACRSDLEALWAGMSGPRH